MKVGDEEVLILDRQNSEMFDNENANPEEGEGDIIESV